MVDLAQQSDESAQAGLRALEQILALAKQDVLVREPRVLVESRDEGLVRAHHAALREGRL